MSRPSIDGEKRANWNWTGRPTIDISVWLFEQQASFRDNFFSHGIPRYMGRGLGSG